jgi:hypothetical protein
LSSPYIVQVTLEDLAGNQVSVPVRLQIGTPYADVLTYGQDFAVVLNAVTDLKPIGMSVTTPQTISGTMKSTPTAGADINRSGLLNFLVPGFINHTVSDLVPGLIPDAIDFAHPNTIKPAETALAAYIAFLQSHTITGDDIASTDDVGNIIGALKRSKLVNRKR